MFKLSISNCLANKTSLDLYIKCIFKGIKPISTEKLNNWDSFMYIPSFFDRQIKQNYHLFKNFRQTTSGTKETFFIPQLNLEMEYIELDHCAGHKMEYTWGSYQRLKITKPFYFREDISEWSGDNEVFSSCLIDKKEPRNHYFQTTNIEIKQQFTKGITSKKFTGSLVFLDENVLPNFKPTIIENLEKDLERI